MFESNNDVISIRYNIIITNCKSYFEIGKTSGQGFECFLGHPDESGRILS